MSFLIFAVEMILIFAIGFILGAGWMYEYIEDVKFEDQIELDKLYKENGGK